MFVSALRVMLFVFFCLGFCVLFALCSWCCCFVIFLPGSGVFLFCFVLWLVFGLLLCSFFFSFPCMVSCALLDCFVCSLFFLWWFYGLLVLFWSYFWFLVLGSLFLVLGFLLFFCPGFSFVFLSGVLCLTHFFFLLSVFFVMILCWFWAFLCFFVIWTCFFFFFNYCFSVLRSTTATVVVLVDPGVQGVVLVCSGSATCSLGYYRLWFAWLVVMVTHGGGSFLLVYKFLYSKRIKWR